MVVPRSSALLPQPFFPPSLPFSLCSVFILGGGGLLHLIIFVGYCIHYMIDTGSQRHCFPQGMLSLTIIPFLGKCSNDYADILSERFGFRGCCNLMTAEMMGRD